MPEPQESKGRDQIPGEPEAADLEALEMPAVENQITLSPEDKPLCNRAIELFIERAPEASLALSGVDYDPETDDPSDLLGEEAIGDQGCFIIMGFDRGPAKHIIPHPIDEGRTFDYDVPEGELCMSIMWLISYGRLSARGDVATCRYRISGESLELTEIKSNFPMIA